MSTLEFRFDLGRLCLNFIATVGSRGSAEPIERLGTPSLLTDWLLESGLAPSKATLPPIGPKELASAIQLREALYRAVHDIFHSRRPQAGDIELINKVAQRAHPPIPQLHSAKRQGHWESQPLTPLTMPQFLSMIARDAIDLLTGPDQAFLRQCAGHACDGIYVDRSRGSRRQWCSSKICGNQARVERFREKADAR